MKMRWLSVIGVWLLTGCVGLAEGGKDLYALADEAAEVEVAEADEVLAQEEKKYGVEWWTREKLVTIVCGVGVLLLWVLGRWVRTRVNKRRSNND